MASLEKGASNGCLNAQEMDEQRQKNVSYQYLCHLEEVKKWMEACIEEELPEAGELEEQLRHGVYLAKLSHFFAPDKVPLRKIYDADLSRFRDSGLTFRHTDNINHFLKALEHIKLPSIFYPETTDVYDRKNMPRVMFCLHALSLHLFRLGIAPQIQSLYGKANFSEEVMEAMMEELGKYGCQMPPFGKIGGILASELPVDEAALHAAVIAVNEAVEKGDSTELLETLSNPVCHLHNVCDANAEDYMACLRDAKARKKEMAINKRREQDYIPDAYDELLTQAEIQGHIHLVNGSTSREQSGASGRHSEAAADEDGAGPGCCGVMAGRSVCPLSACQVVAVVLASLVAVLAVAMLAGGYQAMFNYALHQQLEIREGSTAYDMWKSTPVPLSLRLHVFNLTNPDDFKMGAKPVLQEVGPYVWREYHEKRNVSFHANNTVTYLQQRWWVWDQKASGNNTQEDPITTLNAVPVAAAHTMSNVIVQQILNIAFQRVDEQLIVTTTARKLVFDGVEDPLLEWIQKNIVSKNGSYHYLLPLLNAAGGGLTKFEKFAWFYKRNQSLTYDGEFNMMTGADTLANLGKIDNWNGRNHTSFYEPPCNQLKGSAGELFPPHLARNDLVFFSSDLCMSAKLFYKETVNHGGLSSYRFWGTNHTFANGSTVPGNECYCVAGTCAPMGLLNAESCRMGAPAFVSFPHFYAADPFLVKAVKGVEPNETKHAFYMDLVPELGVPSTVSVKLQINLRITPTPNIDLLKNVPDVYLPMLWFEVRADMPPEMVSQVKTLAFFMSSPFAAVWLWVLLLLAAALVVAGVLLYNLFKVPQQPPYSRVPES